METLLKNYITCIFLISASLLSSSHGMENDPKKEAASEQLITAIEQFVMVHPDFNLPGSADLFIDTMRSGNQDVLLKILNNYPSINGKTSFGRGLIHWALIRDYYDIVKVLVGRGINLDNINLIKLLLFQAIIKGHDDIIENLLSQRDIPIDCIDCFGHNPLIKAIGLKRKNIIKMLLNYSLTDFETKRNMIKTAIAWAKEKGQYAARLKLEYYYQKNEEALIASNSY